MRKKEEEEEEQNCCNKKRNNVSEVIRNYTNKYSWYTILLKLPIIYKI